MHRRDPDLVETQILDIVQFGYDAFQISRAVSVGITERPGEYLICGAAEIVRFDRFQLSVERIHLQAAPAFAAKQENCCRGTYREQQRADQ